MTPHEQMQAQRKRATELLIQIGADAYLEQDYRGWQAFYNCKPSILARIKRWLKGWRK